MITMLPTVVSGRRKGIPMTNSSAAWFEADRKRTFGKRKVVPRACVFDAKEHLRTFLSETLEETGFVVRPCASADELIEAAVAFQPDILIFGLSAAGLDSARALELIAGRGFEGRVLLLGAAASPMVTGLQNLGQRLGLRMRPVLQTPFADRDLRAALAELLPAEQPPPAHIDAREALDAGWLELWYQPKVGTRNLVIDGAEALIRMRHPTWGIVSPACFIPDVGDPAFQSLSEFVIERALNDWRYFVTQRGPIQLAINLPMAFLSRQGAAHDLGRTLPQHAAFDGLIVEMDACEVTADLAYANELARTLQLHNIGLSIDDVGEEWPALTAVADFAFAEIKLDRAFVNGCADDKLRRLACRQIIEFAKGYGARTVAEGVEKRNDYVVLREMGVDQIQGFLMAKPMTAQKLARFRLDVH
jgi:EAL domain-containing protein (putative c-di-GMP-specific phosphodiesterase class I)/CheY-like chemotaxis protein